MGVIGKHSLPVPGSPFPWGLQIPNGVLESESVSHSVLSDSLSPHGLYSLWNSPGQNTGVGSLSFLQGIFPTQGLNPGLPHCRRNLYQLSHQGSHLCFVCPSKLWGRKAPSRWSAPPPSLRNTLGSGFLYLQRSSLGQLSPKPRPPVGKVGVAWVGGALGLWRGPPAGRQ